MDVLSKLQEFMHEYPMDGILDAVIHKNALAKRLKDSGVITNEPFVGKYALIDVEVKTPATGRAKVENADVPIPGAHEYKNMMVTTKRVYATAGLTDELLTSAVGGKASFGKFVDRAIRNCRLDMEITLDRMFAGDGTGRLARASTTLAAGNYTESSPGTVIVDNTRADFGWDRTSRIRAGMLVDAFNISGSTWTQVASGLTVLSVSPSFFTVAGTVLTGGITDGTYIFAHGAVTLNGTSLSSYNEPVGIHALVDDADSAPYNESYNGSYLGTTFQGLPRASYDFLKAKIYKGGDYIVSGTNGTPNNNWSLDDIDNALDTVESGNGGGQVTAIYGNQQMVRALIRRITSEYTINVQASTEKLPYGFYADSYRYNGRSIPILVMKNIPDNTLYLVNEKDFIWFERIGLDWFKQNGSVWFKSPADRKHNYEAWLFMEFNLACKRADNCVRMEDLGYS